MQIHVYIYYPPPKKPNLKIALRDREQCVTPKQNTVAGNNCRGEGLKEKLLTGGRAPKEAVSFLYNNAAQPFQRTTFADF